jgi:hypothetical protein
MSEIREIIDVSGTLLFDEQTGMWMILRWPGLSGWKKGGVLNSDLSDPLERK